MSLLHCFLASTAITAQALLELPQQALPAVENVLSRAHDKAEEFAQQAVTMQKRVEAKQAESANRLSNQRLVYENVLKGETLTNRMISASNRRISMNNRDLESQLLDQRKSAQAGQAGNAMMRDTLQTMEKKFILAKDFLSSSLDTMDDRQQEILKVLLPPPPKPTLRHFLSVAASKFGHKVGLLQEAAVVNSADINPQDWLPMLTESLKSIEDAEREGEIALRNQFLDAMRQCNNTRWKLMQDQKSLNVTRRKLDKVDVQMSRASGVIANSSKFLMERLGGIKFLADRLVDDVDDILRQAEAILDEGNETKIANAKQEAASTEQADPNDPIASTGSDVLAKQSPTIPKHQAAVPPKMSHAVPSETSQAAVLPKMSHAVPSVTSQAAPAAPPQSLDVLPVGAVSAASRRQEDPQPASWWPLSWR